MTGALSLECIQYGSQQTMQGVMIYVLCHYVITWSFIKHGMVSDVRDFKHSLN